jgi:STE24 endopeptidase
MAMLPLSFYSGYLLEHRFGLSRQTVFRWFRRHVLQSLLAYAFGLLLIEGLFLLIRSTGGYWFLAAAAASFFVSVLVGQLVPILIFPLFYRIERLEDPDLADRFSRLAQGTTLTLQGVYRIRLSSETAKANAMLAGLGRTRRVLLGDTLLDGFSADEIEVVLAHEIGHHVFHHIPKMIAGGLVLSLVSFLLCDRVLVAWLAAPDFSYATFPVHGLPLLLLLVTLVSLISSPLTAAISRRFERQCDQYALDCTGMPEAYRSAFQKLARLNKADPEPHRLEVLLMHDHPPIAERLALADK